MDLKRKISIDSWNVFWLKRQVKESWGKKRVLFHILRYLKEEDYILEAGCGSGYFSAQFARIGMNVVLLDFSKEAIRLAKQTFHGLNIKGHFVIGDVRFLPFKDNFNLVFNDGVIEHFKDRFIPLKEMVRVTKSGGKVIIIVPNRFSGWQIIRPLIMKGIPEYPFTFLGLNKIMKEVALKNIEIVGVNVFPLSISPERLGKYFGMLLIGIGTK